MKDKPKRKKSTSRLPAAKAKAAPQEKRPASVKKHVRAKNAASLRETEALFQETFDLAAVGIGHLASDGRWLRANQMLCEIVGYGRSELLERSLPDLIPPEDAGDVRQSLEQMRRGEIRASALEVRALRKDGFPLWVSLTMSPVLNAAGRVRYLVTIIEDITGRRRMEDGLRLFRTAVQSFPQGITISDMDGKIIYMNAAEARMHGYSVDELLGKDARLLAPLAQRGRLTLREMIDRNLIADRPLTREVKNLRRDGTEFPVTISSVPVRDMRGTPLGLVSVSEDITERKRIIDALTESELKYRTLFESANDAIFIADQESGVITDCNAKACELLDRTRDEIIGMRQDRLRAPDPDGPPLDEPGRPVDGVRAGLLTDSSVSRRDGTRVWVDISSTFFEVRGKRFTMAVYRNVTERRKAQLAIIQSKQDWENTFDTITDMITIHDEHFTIVRSNKAAAKILGLPWLEVGKAKCYELYHGTDCPPAACPSCQSLRSGAASVHELFEPHLGRHLEVHAIPRHDAGGRMTGLIHVVRDITDRKRDEEEKAALQSRLRDAEKMEVIGSLAGGVAHEVRNPLNAIMALTDALDREVGGNPEYRTYMQHMRTQVDRLTTLMNDLLELGKPVERSTLHRESLADICAISVDAWKQSKWGRGREIAVSLSREAQGATLLADAKKLQQVFINLLDNAAQHSPEGAPVRIEASPPAGGKAEVRVVDQGGGIPAEILPKVFDTFFTTRRGGTGLGLSIVKHIIEKHGGSIALVNNDPPPGCTASVALPVLEEVR
jgi:PAS domain S-box-containing protein